MRLGTDSARGQKVMILARTGPAQPCPALGPGGGLHWHGAAASPSDSQARAFDSVLVSPGLPVFP